MKENQPEPSAGREACSGSSPKSSCCGTAREARTEFLTLRELFSGLEPWLDDERCRTCDCLQGALTQIEIEGDDELREKAARHTVPKEEMHSCLGCKPCPPAGLWGRYLSSRGATS